MVELKVAVWIYLAADSATDSAAGSATCAAGAQAAQTADDQRVELDRRGLIEKSIQQPVVMRRRQVERLPDCLLFRARVAPLEPFELEHRAFAIGE